MRLKAFKNFGPMLEPGEAAEQAAEKFGDLPAAILKEHEDCGSWSSNGDKGFDDPKDALKWVLNIMAKAGETEVPIG